MSVFFNNATPGKKLLSIKVLPLSGSKLSFMRALARSLLKLASCVTIIPLIINIFLFNIDKRKRCIHDFICNTADVSLKKSALLVDLLLTIVVIFLSVSITIFLSLSLGVQHWFKPNFDFESIDIRTIQPTMTLSQFIKTRNNDGTVVKSKPKVHAQACISSSSGFVGDISFENPIRLNLIVTNESAKNATSYEEVKIEKVIDESGESMVLLFNDKKDINHLDIDVFSSKKIHPEGGFNAQIKLLKPEKNFNKISKISGKIYFNYIHPQNTIVIDDVLSNHRSPTKIIHPYLTALETVDNIGFYFEQHEDRFDGSLKIVYEGTELDKIYVRVIRGDGKVMESSYHGSYTNGYGTIEKEFPSLDDQIKYRLEIAVLQKEKVRFSFNDISYNQACY